MFSKHSKIHKKIIFTKDIENKLNLSKKKGEQRSPKNSSTL